jgi:hypothetical protein
MNKPPDLQDRETEAPACGNGNTIDLDRVREITRRIVSRPILDPRSPKDILDDAWAKHD